MEPVRKRAAVPAHPLRLAGPGSTPSGPHRVWPAVVSTLRVMAIDVTGPVLRDPASQWQLSGWCGDGVPIVIVLATGNRALLGQVGVEIITYVAAPVTIDLPGGGRQRVQPYRRMNGGVGEVFIDALFGTSRLKALSMAEATDRIARLDAERHGVSLYATRQTRFDKFCRGIEQDLWAALIVDTDVVPRLGSDILAAAPENTVISTLFMIDQRCHAARVALTPTMLCRIAASLAMHCHRYKFGWFTVLRLIEKLLCIMGVSSFKLQQLLSASQPTQVREIPGLAARWPEHAAKTIALSLSFEEACELGCSFTHGKMPDGMLMHGGRVYLGPETARSEEMRGFANARLAGAMTAEMRRLAENLQKAGEDEDWSHHEHWLSEFAVPLAFGSANERVMPVAMLDDALANISDKSLQFEERKLVAKTLALGCNIEERAHYYERFVEAMKKFNAGKARTDELLRWMKWYMMSRGIG